jgi:A/G-specific adenine glycosylase
MSVSPEIFRKILIDWYLENKRDLPWRTSTKPYSVWLSEIILQQTRVDQGLPFYLKFVKEFPTVHELADASEIEVLKLWQGLGYYTRARNLHATAQYISKELQGVFPSNYNSLIKLKGVGDYTASAIASICYNEPTAVVDGNVYRVLGRLLGVELSIDELAGKKYFKSAAQKLIDPEDPGTFNQALMEFGSRFCIPRSPDCTSCIFKDECVAFQLNKVSEFPKRSKKTQIKKIFYNYFVPLSEDQKTLLVKRISNGFWHQLYEFPLIETDGEVGLSFWENNVQYKVLSSQIGIKSIQPLQTKSVVHKLSHRHIYAKFWMAELSKELQNGIPINDLEQYPVPRLIDKMIPSLFCSEHRM